MSRLAACLLLAGVVGLSAVADDTPPLPKLPKFKDFTALPRPVAGKVKAVKDDTLTITATEFSVKPSSGRSRRPPSVKEKEVEYTLTLHPDALVRREQKPTKSDDKGRRKEFTPAEMRRLKAPAGAPGYAAELTDLTAGQAVEVVLLLPAKIKSTEVVEQDYRVKWVVIKSTPTGPDDKKPAEPKKK